ncbi:hypothetical protein EVAR_96032_1 [Eumeta japonica]|uniref:Uncharacterized protein n=1 Tax=Eumeta variegata TaxID=151549 RepID=A0A4C1SK29_EUMVA|nr:hypothetical protein EVAR_96032_1 [Eumeta japonica]
MLYLLSRGQQSSQLAGYYRVVDDLTYSMLDEVLRQNSILGCTDPEMIAKLNTARYDDTKVPNTWCGIKESAFKERKTVERFCNDNARKDFLSLNMNIRTQIHMSRQSGLTSDSSHMNASVERWRWNCLRLRQTVIKYA